jgi:hypothetical protein
MRLSPVASLDANQAAEQPCRVSTSEGALTFGNSIYRRELPPRRKGLSTPRTCYSPVSGILKATPDQGLTLRKAARVGSCNAKRPQSSKQSVTRKRLKCAAIRRWTVGYSCQHRLRSRRPTMGWGRRQAPPYGYFLRQANRPRQGRCSGQADPQQGNQGRELDQPGRRGQLWEDADPKSLTVGSYWSGPWGVNAQLTRMARSSACCGSRCPRLLELAGRTAAVRPAGRHSLRATRNHRPLLGDAA